MLTQEQIDSYHADGFVRVEGLFSTDETDELAARLQGDFAQANFC